VDWALALDGKGFCSGFVKNPQPESDVLRLCFLNKGTSTFFDHTLDEAFTVASILAASASEFIKKHVKGKLNI